LDLNEGYADPEIKSLDKYSHWPSEFYPSPSYTFNSTTKIYLCSDVDSASALSCTISHLQLTPIYPYPTQGLGDFTRKFFSLKIFIMKISAVTQAFYSLTNGEFSSLISGAGEAYFGDSASSPTDGTSPSFDSSVNHICFLAY